MLSSVSCFLILLLLRFSTDPLPRLRGHSRPSSYDQGGWKGGPGPVNPSWFLNDGTTMLCWCIEPMMQQLHSFLLFCYCDDKAIRTTFKPSYISKYMGRAQPNHPGFSMTGPRYALLMYYHSVTMSHLVKQENWVFVDKLALRDKLNVVVCVLLSYFSSLLFLHWSSVAA